MDEDEDEDEEEKLTRSSVRTIDGSMKQLDQPTPHYDHDERSIAITSRKYCHT